MSTTTPGERTINNLLIGALVTLIALLGIPGIFAVLGLPGAPSKTGWWILGAACAAFLIKLLASETATGEFEFYKFGYDCCITTLGATISALAVQLYSSSDIYPGMANITYLPTFSIIDDPVRIRIAQLGSFFVLTWIVTLFVARICGAIKKKEVQERSGKAFACTILGTFLLFAYAIIISSKG